MLREGTFNPGHEIATICLVIDVLKLAPAAFWKVTAWRVLMVRAWRKRTIVEQRVTRNAKRHVASA
jgi:hypothetical protein